MVGVCVLCGKIKISVKENKPVCSECRVKMKIGKGFRVGSFAKTKREIERVNKKSLRGF